MPWLGLFEPPPLSLDARVAIFAPSPPFVKLGYVLLMEIRARCILSVHHLKDGQCRRGSLLILRKSPVLLSRSPFCFDKRHAVSFGIWLATVCCPHFDVSDYLVLRAVCVLKGTGYAQRVQLRVSDVKPKCDEDNDTSLNTRRISHGTSLCMGPDTRDPVHITRDVLSLVHARPPFVPRAHRWTPPSLQTW